MKHDLVNYEFYQLVFNIWIYFIVFNVTCFRFRTLIFRFLTLDYIKCFNGNGNFENQIQTRILKTQVTGEIICKWVEGFSKLGDLSLSLSFMYYKDRVNGYIVYDFVYVRSIFNKTDKANHRFILTLLLKRLKEQVKREYFVLICNSSRNVIDSVIT